MAATMFTQPQVGDAGHVHARILDLLVMQGDAGHACTSLQLYW